ncbi:MAG: hypothetical protein MK179_11460 [Pirellulaceae bacterium]|nr:hypothetical protein [Pirellulaceae bacterium]
MWANSLVVSSFMGGLALGNALAARYGDSLDRPVRIYAYLELMIGVIGFGLVLLFPFLNVWLAPRMTSLLNQHVLLGTLRFAIGFGLLLIPTASMGQLFHSWLRGSAAGTLPLESDWECYTVAIR